MSAFFRFLSRRRTGRGYKPDAPSPEKQKNIIVCKVILLDNSTLTVDLNVSIMVKMLGHCIV